MKAGKYYIGDLCYVLSNEDWDEVCELTINGNECLSGEFQFKDGRPFAMYNTKYGDGVYRDQFGNEYSVDSGTIGCILVDHITKREYDNLNELGNIVDMEHEFDTCSSNGLIKISSTTIDTAEEWEDEYDEEELI
jgi:hypothetical protein